MKTHVFGRALATIALSVGAVTGSAQTVFQQTNLVSNRPNKAAHTDPNLVNPWGISLSGSSPFWVSDNGTGVSTLYNGTGTPLALVVSLPGGGGNPALPTGQVFNANAAAGAFNQDVFLFASQTGTINGWRGSLGTNAEIVVDKSGTPAQFTGLAIGSVGGNSYLYAANFGEGKIDVFPDTGAPVLTGDFTDPSLPAGYAPFNIQRLGSTLYAEYALNSGGDEVHGAGLGLIDQFDLNGNFLGRLTTGGLLNAPWGVAIAPASFHEFAGDLLVGNFGDGTINAYNLTTGAYAGTLSDNLGNPLVIDGIWGITPGNGGTGGSPNRIYFAAGPNDEQDGLFGSIAAVPDVTSTALLLVVGAAALAVARRRRTTTSLVVAPAA